MKIKLKKCRICARDFTPISSMSKVCSVPCSLEWSRKLAEKKAAQDARTARVAAREARERVKTRGEHLRELQEAVNKFVRIRDADDGCISCDRPATWGGQWHASHFKSVGHAPALRFNLLNIHKACSICNRHLGGNYAGYKPRLIEKIGQEQVDWLEGPAGNEPLKITVAEIIELKAYYRAEVRRLTKERA